MSRTRIEYSVSPTAEDVGAEPTLDDNQKRAIYVATTDPKSSDGENGDIWYNVSGS